jgi:4-amino-4-deoxy-L-arabinose transferase-like glycosyltransferase
MRAQITVLPARHRMSSRLKIGHVILIFALAAVPFAATFATYYPDERHYTDGALMMLQHGDWLVPHTAAGPARFEKPILAYWAVAASYLAFGVNTFASRLPFLLACCGTLWLTYRLAKKLTGDSQIALLATVVLASNAQFLLCGVRSIPDALLMFFITLSVFGFFRLMVFEEFTTGAFWMAYGGAAGAALSKGLLGAGIVGFVWAFVFLRRRDFQDVKKLIHWPSLATATVLTLSWFVYIFATHGEEALATFFGDQVVGNMHGHFWTPAMRVPLFTLVLIFNFLPWSVTVIEFLARGKFFVGGAVPPLAQKFILSWTVFLIVVFSFGENVSLRYLLPATPLMAILFAGWLKGSEQVKLIFSTELILKIVLVALVIGDLAAIYIDSQWPLPIVVIAIIGGLILFAVFVLGFDALWRKKIPVTEALGLAILCGWLLLFAAALPILLPDRSQQIAAALEQDNSSKTVLLIGDVKLASRVRVLLGKKWTLKQTDRFYPSAVAGYSRILVSEKDAGWFADNGWKIEMVAASKKAPPLREIWAAFKARRLPEALALYGQKICLVTRE